MQQTSVSINARRPSAGVAILDIEGDLTAASEAALMNAYTSVDGAPVTVIVLNFNQLEYMNSSGIGLLVTLLVRINRNRQRLVATGLNEHYSQIFEVTRLSEAIEIFDSEAAALAHFSA
jgi:anti-sigma B factor antagonist